MNHRFISQLKSIPSQDCIMALLMHRCMTHATICVMGYAASTSNDINHMFSTKVDAVTVVANPQSLCSALSVTYNPVSAWFVFYQVIVTIICAHQLFCFGAVVTKVGEYVV